MEIQAAIVLVLVFFLMLAMSVPVSFSIISGQTQQEPPGYHLPQKSP